MKIISLKCIGGQNIKTARSFNAVFDSGEECFIQNDINAARYNFIQDFINSGGNLEPEYNELEMADKELENFLNKKYEEANTLTMHNYYLYNKYKNNQDVLSALGIDGKYGKALIMRLNPFEYKDNIELQYSKYLHARKAYQDNILGATDQFIIYLTLYQQKVSALNPLLKGGSGADYFDEITEYFSDKLYQYDNIEDLMGNIHSEDPTMGNIEKLIFFLKTNYVSLAERNEMLLNNLQNNRRHSTTQEEYDTIRQIAIDSVNGFKELGILDQVDQLVDSGSVTILNK